MGEPRIYPDPVVDRTAKIIRGVFGVLLGLGVAASIWIRSGGFGLMGTAILLVVCVPICCFGSIRGGDAFWMSALRRRQR